MQSRLSSFIEAAINILIGFFIALGTQIVLFPMFDIHVEMDTHLWIGAWFTLISLIRSYIIRRWFNARIHRAATALSGGDHGENTREKS